MAPRPQSDSSEDETRQSFLCTFCRRQRFLLERDLHYHQASCPYAPHHTVDALTSTSQQINGINGSSSSFTTPQPIPQDLIYRSRRQDSGTEPDRIRGGQSMSESTSSSSQSNGVGAPTQILPYNGATSHGSARSRTTLASSLGIPTAPSPELLTVRLRSSEQPIAGSTRYTVWENVIEMPRDTPYPSLSGMRYTFTPYSRVSQVDVPDEGGEDHGNETNDLVGASWDA